MLSEMMGPKEEIKWTVLRIIAGLMFLLHGLIKVTSFGDSPSILIIVGGIVEVVVGIGFGAGLLTRLMAAGGVIYMAAVIVTQHLTPFSTSVLNPIGNYELALLYLLIFAYGAAKGPGKLSLDNDVVKKELI